MLRRIPLLTFALVAFIGTAELAAQVPIVWADEGPLTWTPRPTESAIAANDLRTHLYQIADDSMKGRDAISLENTMTTDYVAAVFERLGLQPAGDDGYFQELEYGPIAFDRAASALRIDDRGLTTGTDWVPSGADSRSAVSGSFQGEDVETVFGGLFGDKSPLPATVRGKAVVLLAGPGAGMPQRRSIYRTDTRAQDAGAALVMIATEELSAALVTSTFDGRTSMMGPDDASTAGAVLSLSAAAALFEAPLQSVQVGAPGKTVSGAWSEEYRRPEYPTRNVIAILPGSDPALRDEYVLVGAHNDHVGMVNNGPVDHDSLRAFNRIMRPQGANDRPGPPVYDGIYPLPRPLYSAKHGFHIQSVPSSAPSLSTRSNLMSDGKSNTQSTYSNTHSNTQSTSSGMRDTASDDPPPRPPPTGMRLSSLSCTGSRRPT